jgi:hypothetical protein
MGMGGSPALQMLVQETKMEQAHLQRRKVVLEKEIAHQKGMHSSSSSIFSFTDGVASQDKLLRRKH